MRLGVVFLVVQSLMLFYDNNEAVAQFLMTHRDEGSFDTRDGNEKRCHYGENCFCEEPRENCFHQDLIY